MGVDGVKESWFSSIWGTRKSGSQAEKAEMGILAFEIATLMSKVINLWNCLSDVQISRLRADVMNSLGIVKLVSDDENYLMNLAFAEIVENLSYVTNCVIRLGKRCSNPVYHRLEQIFNSPEENSVQWYGWEYGWKKMEKKVRKLEKFVAATSQLHQEMDVLVELEQTLRRMQCNPETNRVKLLEFQQKVIWQRQEVKNLRGMSPWSRTYNYIVQLLSRCLVTVIERLKYLLGINQVIFSDKSHLPGDQLTAECLTRSRSFVQSSVHPSENHTSMFYSGPLVRSSSLLGLPTRSRRASKKSAQQTHQHVRSQHRKLPFLKTKRLVQSGPFKGCMIGGSDSPVIESCMPTNNDPSLCGSILLTDINRNQQECGSSPSGNMLLPSSSVLLSQSILSHTPQCSLGSSALTLHYANIIILIEKLAACPHLIAPDARDDLYDMLTISIRSMLRARLKLYSKSLVSASYDAGLATEWSLAITRMLEWLSPVAHNTVRWYSERNYEKQHIVPRGCLLLVQTLYFANQSKTEAAIVELLLGLNYLYRFGNQVNENALLGMGMSGTRGYEEFSIQRDTIACNA